VIYMKTLTDSPMSNRLGIFTMVLLAVALMAACSSIPSTMGETERSKLAVQTEQIQKLKSAEYHDYMTAMTFEDSNRKLGNYYLAKGSHVHSIIDQMEEGHEVSYDEIRRALDNSDSTKYDDRPPVPLDDMTGSGY